MASRGKKKDVKQQKVEEVKYPAEEFFADKGPKTGPEVLKKVGPSKLNFRALPSKDAKVLSILDPGDVVTVVEDGAEWSKVIHNSVTGYVMTKFIE